VTGQTTAYAGTGAQTHHGADVHKRDTARDGLRYIVPGAPNFTVSIVANGREAWLVWRPDRRIRSCGNRVDTAHDRPFWVAMMQALIR
jgi:hypothetical protein